MVERISSINMHRIKWCCEEFGMGYGDLADELGIPVLRKLEQAKRRGLTYRQLRKVADFFDRGLLFFIGDEPISTETAYSPLFRTLAGARPELGRDTNLLMRRVEGCRELYEDLLEDLGYADEKGWEGDLGGGRSTSPVELAKLARKWLGVDETKVDYDSLRIAIEGKGILVFMSIGEPGKKILRLEKNSNVRGFSLYDKATPAILVNKMPNYGTSKGGENIQSFTLMHELGHLLLHKGAFITEQDYIYSRRKKEKEANQFAANFLIPQEHLGALRGEGLRGLDGQQLEKKLKPHAKDWGVNTMVVALRLLLAKMISRGEYASFERYKEFCREQAKAKRKEQQEKKNRKAAIPRFRDKETLAMYGSLYTNAVLDALSAEQITLSKASKYLGDLDISYVHKLQGREKP